MFRKNKFNEPFCSHHPLSPCLPDCNKAQLLREASWFPASLEDRRAIGDSRGGRRGGEESSCTSTVHVPVPAVLSCPCLGLKLAAWGRCLEGARRCSLCPHRAGASGCLDNHLFSLPRHLPCSIKVRSPAGHSGFVVLTLALFAPRLVGSPFREDGTGQLKPPYRPVGM